MGLHLSEPLLDGPQIDVLNPVHRRSNRLVVSRSEIAHGGRDICVTEDLLNTGDVGHAQQARREGRTELVNPIAFSLSSLIRRSCWAKALRARESCSSSSSVSGLRRLPFGFHSTTTTYR
jgi:hypothetical protein